MFFIEFRNICREYCNMYDMPNPSKKRYREIWKDYRESLLTAPVPDNDVTLGQYLDTLDWTEEMIKKDKYCIDPDCRGCDIERSPELVKAMEFTKNNFCFAPLPKAVPCVPSMDNDLDCYIRPRKEEGKIPMRYNDNYASASANVTAPQSDTATQRDFLLKELASAHYPKTLELTKVFNLYVDNTPKTYKEMIDIIETKKYTIDPKIAKKVDDAFTSDNDNELEEYCYGPMDGIIWPGPKADFDGHKAATKELANQYKAANRTIVTSDAAGGLKALQAFEAWTPSVTASSDTAH